MKYIPDDEEDCKICGTSPTVIVVGHSLPDTCLCGACFFIDRDMIHPDTWNEDSK